MKKLFTLAAALLLMGSASAQMYNLVKVTAVKDGGLYVFERNGHVLVAEVPSSNSTLQTTDDYLTTSLTGTETYVWMLEGDNEEGFFIRSEAKYADNPSGHIYLNNKSKKTDMSLSNTSTSAWKFTFEGDKALIYNANNGDRFLGETDPGANTYKAYATSNLSTYGHDFTVYELQESTAPFISVEPAAADFGSQPVGGDVDAIELVVMFGNLKGNVTYSALEAPFAVTGKVEKTGDKLTVTASAAAIGVYEQTLTVQSVDDKESVEVTVKMTVVDPAAGYAKMTGEMVEGDYVLTSGEYALKAAIAENSKGEKLYRFDNGSFTLSGDVLAEPDESIIWHIAPSGTHWTLYNQSVGQYAASTDVKNKGTLLDDADTDNALWNITVTEDNTYEFENVARAAGTDPNNKWLRNNTTYGFACYAAETGKPLTLYRISGTPTAVEQTQVTEKAVKAIEDGRVIIIRDGVRYNAQGVRLQ